MRLQDAGIHSVSLIGPKTCAEYVAALSDDLHWSSARVHYEQAAGNPGKLRPQMRRAEANGLYGVPEIVESFRHRVASTILPAVNQMYRTTHNTIDEHQAVRYEIGGEFKIHTDTGKNLEHRQFTVLCYLNDDFEGGETVFPDFDIAIKPKTGMAITFPCEYRHGALPLRTGMKYIYLCWIVATNRVKWL